jgi:hypothetical protein
MSEMTTTVEPSTLGLHTLESYAPLIGSEPVERLLRKTQNVRDLHVIHVSSTFSDRADSEDPGLRQRLGARARDTVRENFLMSRLLEDWIDLLSDIPMREP